MKLLLENWRRFLKEDTVVPTDINRKVISIYDFDETIARSEGHIDVVDKETGQHYKRITTQQEYDKLAATGDYEFDFSNLDYVINPTELVPVTKQLRSAVESRHIQAMILTAKAGNAEGEIQMYLDSIGIPTDDLIIIGCAGCNKGEYIEDLVRRNPTIEVVHFFDDSDTNIRDVQGARERLCDLDRLRFFFINQVGPEAEIEKRGSAVCANSKAAALADLFSPGDPKPEKYRPGTRRRGPGGMIVEKRRKK